MANAQLLEQKINESGKTKKFLARKCGLSRQWFSNITKTPDKLTYSQVLTLCEELDITSKADAREIFLP